MDHRRIDQLLRAQDGVISRAQAVSAGLTVKQIEYRLATRSWLPVHRGVYRLAAVVPSPATSLRAASLWVGERGVLIGAGAAWWWEMAPAPAGWRFATGQGFQLAGHRDVCVVRTFVDPVDIVHRDGIRLVRRPLAVLQTAAELERQRAGSGIVLIDRARQRRWVTRYELEAAHARSRGSWGNAAIGVLLKRTGDLAHSELERAGLRELRAAGITDFILNYATVLPNGRKVELDVAFVELGLGLEFDGFAFHSDPEQQRADLRRANDIMAAGWLLRRFTWSDVIGDPETFVRTVRDAIDAAEFRRIDPNYPGQSF